MFRLILGSICLMAASGIWGGMFVISKYLLEYVSPFVLLWLRFLIAFIVLGACLMFRKKERVQRSDWLFMVWLGFIGYLAANGSGFIGTYLSTAHMGSLITAASPAFTLVLAYWLLKEKLTLKKMISVAMATCGVVIVIGMETTEGSRQMIGNLFLVLGALAWALYCVSVKKIAAKYSSLAISAYATGAALLVTTPAMMIDLNMEDLYNLKEMSIWMGILYLGVVATAIAFFLWNKGMEYLEAGIGSMFYFFTPVIGGLFGWLFLGEKLSWSFFAGGLLIFMGTLLVVLRNPVSMLSTKRMVNKSSLDSSHKQGL
ncbi:DMT family transporter [Ectobacillus funiculus]|uniref:DMT family transporter n=1 Tax=Ectobacillus funiculus TaxID=137993 RepID=UPI003979E5C3